MFFMCMAGYVRSLEVSMTLLICRPYLIYYTRLRPTGGDERLRAVPPRRFRSFADCGVHDPSLVCGIPFAVYDKGTFGKPWDAIYGVRILSVP